MASDNDPIETTDHFLIFVFFVLWFASLLILPALLGYFWRYEE